jgi:PST family polysaccharide transporter
MGLFAFSKPIAKITFGDGRYTNAVALLSMAVFFSVASGGQSALVQGMRRIGDLARSNMLGALYGTVFSVAIVYYCRERGIVLFLVVVAGMNMLTSWWYARKIKLEKISISWQQVMSEASGLLKLGLAFMASALLSAGTAYLVRAFVLRRLGVDAAGFYQAAWTLAGLYVGFILQAMGADFFPRLTAVANNNIACNRLVNEQTEVGLLIAVPGILATLCFAPLVIQLFYSARFEPSVVLLQWNCLGMILRVASWPMGFILMAKGERGLFMLTESLTNIVYLLLVWAGVSVRGLPGIGMAFLGMYLFCFLLVLFVVRRLSGFRWSTGSIRLGLIFIPIVTAVFIATQILPLHWSIALGVCGTLSACYYSLRTINTMISLDRLPSFITKVLALFRM